MALKSLGLPNKTWVCGTNALKISSTMNFETKSTLRFFNCSWKKFPLNFSKYLSYSEGKKEQQSC